MIEEIAQVTGLRGDKMLVEVLRQSACQGCEVSGSCGTGSLGRLLGFKSRPLLIDNEQKLAVGDRLVIGIGENAYLLAAMLVYILPLFSMFVLALVVNQFGMSDGGVVLAACGGLAGGIAVAGRLSQHYFSKRLEARMIRRIY